VCSSLSALGYHEYQGGDPALPIFINDLRLSAFSRAFSGDKNVAIFLGRPPRMHSKYCRAGLPGQHGLNIPSIKYRGLSRQMTWEIDAPISYMADTQWSTICAVLKEDVLDLSQIDDLEERARRAAYEDAPLFFEGTNFRRSLEAEAKMQWLALPPHFRLTGPLKSCASRPMERDFLISVRLNHLHIMFLLRLVLQRHIPEPSADLVVISASMLSICIEGALLKNELANSGTSLVWKVGNIICTRNRYLCAAGCLLRAIGRRNNLSLAIKPLISH
jgi:hypothetical protein